MQNPHPENRRVRYPASSGWYADDRMAWLMENLPVSSATGRPLPYMWGNIQGWIQIVWGIGTGFLAWAGLTRGLFSFKMRIILFVSAALYLFVGIGILRKRRYGFVLVCVCMILTLVMYYQVLIPLPSRSELLPVARTVYWIFSFFYYLRRRRDLKLGW